MDSRIEQLREWLAEREERVIVIVGHGQFFKRCLNRGFVQANVSVLECSFSARSGFSLQAELHPAAEVAAGEAAPPDRTGPPSGRQSGAARTTHQSSL